MYYHTRKSRKHYKSFTNHPVCDFCNPHTHTRKLVRETEHCFIIENRSFYSQWELRTVIDHLMIIPKRHVLSLSKLTPEERVDVMDLIAEYEGKGYDIFARSPGSKTRSVPHQHTHLIKTEDRPSRGMVFLRRPYILWRIR